MTHPQRLRAFQRRLLAWYQVSQRKLPWRETRDPYKILVSEIMLQQTQVDRVVPKYHEFLKRYPTLKALARARTPDLRRTWYPLGYNVRPLRLRRMAQQAMRDHHGQVPDSYDGLLAMDGIGRYTAGAVLSFAFNQDAPILDTNVARLLSRYFGKAARPPRSASRDRAGHPAAGGVGDGSAVDRRSTAGHLDGGRSGRSPSRPALRGRLDGGRSDGRTTSSNKRLWQLAAAVIPPGKGYDINQAMMDFGAMVCTARAPRCPTCSLRRACRSFPIEPSTRPSASLPGPPARLSPSPGRAPVAIAGAGRIIASPSTGSGSLDQGSRARSRDKRSASNHDAPRPRPQSVRVALAVIERRGRYLICQRPPGKFLGGYWEFPGGKCESGESWEACLRRELREELGVTVRAVRAFGSMQYRSRRGAMRFKVYRCAIAHGRPRPLEVAALRWVKPNELTQYRFPPANRNLLAILQHGSDHPVSC